MREAHCEGGTIWSAGCVLWLAAVILTCTPVAGAVGKGPALLSVRQLTHSAAVIVVGDVVAVASEWDRAKTRIVTRVELAPEEVLKGSVSHGRVFVVQLGGRVGDIGAVIGEAPSFRIGERVVLFLVPGQAELRVLALSQGKFEVQRDGTTGVDLAIRRSPGSGHTIDQMTLEQLRSEVKTALSE